MTPKRGQLAFLAFLLLIPVYVFHDIATRFVEEGVASGSAENDAAMFPKLIAALLLILLVIQITTTVLKKTDAVAMKMPSWGVLWRRYRRAVAVFVLFVLYLPAFRWFGFLYSTPVFIILLQLVLGYRNPVAIAAFSVGVTGAVWLAFARVLNLVLPVGDIFG
ncbi:MAG: tripartite tricarboxylate transporter TctB family protein [Rhodospirillales bacterium]|nr:tripartite tricarboxylate transporter TctB family protein [Rhodospirillales bacterium]